MIDGRRFSIWARDPRRSDRKFGPGGEGIFSPVSRQFKSGSWMNYIVVSYLSKNVSFASSDLQLQELPSVTPCYHAILS